MFIWHHQLKQDEAGEPTGGADQLLNPENIRVELGIPHEVDDTPTLPVVAAPAKKDDPDAAWKKGMETELATVRRQNSDLQASERYWAEQARLGTARPAEAVAADPVTAADVEIDETPEALADDFLKRGVKALRDRGFVSKADVAKMVAEGVAESNENLQAARNDATHDAQLAREFPEIAEDGIRVRNGEQPTSEIYKRAAPIFRAMVKMDPELAKSKSALIMAARTAAAEIKAEGKKVTVPAAGDRGEGQNSHEARRERIDRQRTDRSEGGGAETDTTPTLSADQKSILRNLKVSEADFVKNSDKSAAAGGRRGR